MWYGTAVWLSFQPWLLINLNADWTVSLCQIHHPLSSYNACSLLNLCVFSHYVCVRRFKNKKEALEAEADPERDQRTVFAYQVCGLLVFNVYFLLMMLVNNFFASAVVFDGRCLSRQLRGIFMTSSPRLERLVVLHFVYPRNLCCNDWHYLHLNIINNCRCGILSFACCTSCVMSFRSIYHLHA